MLKQSPLAIYSGQINIFDVLGSTNGSKGNSNEAWKSAPKGPPVADYSPQKKLSLEKELLGFYVSDHPLKSADKVAKVLSPISLNELADQNKRTIISAIVMLTEVKPHLTKKGDRMAFVQMEDMTAQAEAVVFPTSYERIGSLIQTDARLIIWGKVDRRDDQPQLIIEDAELVEEAQMVVVELTPQRITHEALTHLKAILQEHSGQKSQGKVPVLAKLATPYQHQFVRFNSKYRVQDHQAVVQALNAAGFTARASSITSAS